jgi:hypothetical protein
MIVAEQATKACPPHHRTRLATNGPLPRDQLVIETLMIALGMIMGQVLMDHIIQGAFTQYDHLIEGLLFDGAHKPFAVGIQIRTAGRLEERFHTTVFQHPIEC